MSEIMTGIFDNQVLVDLLMSAAILVGAMIAARILTYLLKKIKSKITVKTSTILDDQIIDVTRKPARILIYLTGVYLAIGQLDFAFLDVFQPQTDGVFFVLFLTTITYYAVKLAHVFVRWYLREVATKTESDLDEALAPLAGRVIKIVIVIIAAITGLDHFGIDVKALVVSLGVGSVAIAFAAKETLENMIAGFVIMLDRPFRTGDRVKLTSTGELGDVVSIGLRSTKILNFENTIVIIPNAEIVRAQIINLSYPDKKIRIRIQVGVAYGSDLLKVKQVLEQTMKNNAEILDDPPPTARFLEFGDSSLNLVLDGRTEEYTNQWRLTEEIRLAVYSAFEREGIQIPFPQRVVHMAQKSSEDAGKKVA